MTTDAHKYKIISHKVLTEPLTSRNNTVQNDIAGKRVAIQDKNLSTELLFTNYTAVLFSLLPHR